jgi:hypothetical protein
MKPRLTTFDAMGFSHAVQHLALEALHFNGKGVFALALKLKNSSFCNESKVSKERWGLLYSGGLCGKYRSGAAGFNNK